MYTKKGGLFETKAEDGMSKRVDMMLKKEKEK